MSIETIVGQTIKQWVDEWGYEAPEFTDIARFCDLLVGNYFLAELENEVKKRESTQNH